MYMHMYMYMQVIPRSMLWAFLHLDPCYLNKGGGTIVKKDLHGLLVGGKVSSWEGVVVMRMYM